MLRQGDVRAQVTGERHLKNNKVGLLGGENADSRFQLL